MADKVSYKRVWYCVRKRPLSQYLSSILTMRQHNCEDGPLTCGLITGCPMCGHKVCDDCKTYKIKIPSR
jgi:hypothetical protein